MLNTTLKLLIALCCFSVYSIHAQVPETESVSLLTPFRILLPSPDIDIEYLDLDGDGDPDACALLPCIIFLYNGLTMMTICR